MVVKCLILLSAGISLAQADINIDLTKAFYDEPTGQYCVMEKVCIANPPEALTSAGCAPQYPPGCDCDPAAPDPSSVCDAGYQCVQCKCLPPGCNCDEGAEDPDSFCSNGEVCKDCKCSSRLPPGCDCDPDIPNADDFCPGETRCVGCKCQDCPASSGRREKVLNPPLVFVIDTTKSVKPDKDSIFNLTAKVVNRIKKDKINIPRYQLVTFNDFGPAINQNVRLEVDTADVTEFGRATSQLLFESYTGGRDSKERLTQGLLVALQNASDRSLIVVFTDNGSKDLDLEKEIVRLRDAKGCEVFIVLTPEYEGRPRDRSLPTYYRMGKVFLVSEVGADSFLQTVEEFEEGNCL